MKINYKLIIKIGIFLLFIGLVTKMVQVVNNISGVKDAITLATTVKPETFTELYFEDHLSLPNQIVYLWKDRDDRFTINNFRFTIHNLENKDMKYLYEVYINVNGKKIFIYEASVFIKSGEYKTITQNFSVALPKEKVMVVVNLINKNQQIDYWN